MLLSFQAFSRVAPLLPGASVALGPRGGTSISSLAALPRPPSTGSPAPAPGPGPRIGTGWPRWGLVTAGLGLSSVAAAAAAGDARAGGDSDDLDGEKWVDSLAGRPGVREAGAPSQILTRHPLGQLLAGDAHMFDAMARVDMVKDLRCFYDGKEKQFHAVVQLGRDVCGYPSAVHGGLTAAIVDETLGGLMVSLWREGALGISPPAVTARLEVDYCKVVPQNALILCTAEVEQIEGRKMWLTATVSDGRDNGSTYATARALFVAPGILKVMTGWVSGPKGR